MSKQNQEHDYPATPAQFSQCEERSIMRDFEESKIEAMEQGDALRLSYLVYG